MIGTEQEALYQAIAECATNGTEWVISSLSDGKMVEIWNIERDTKVDDDDLTWPVIVHLLGPMASEGIAILSEVVAEES